MNDNALPPAAGWRADSLAISASAGYGKTEILALRILALLLAGCGSGEFIAMTFSRAAAAEIYGRLLLMVSQALDSEERFRELKARLKRECRSDAFDAVAPDDLLALLGMLVREMPRLRISTFDSFFMTIVRCFPLELGLPGNAKLIPEEGAEAVRVELLRRLSSGAAEGGDFVAICREMMFGEEKKSLCAICCEMLTTLESFYSRRNDSGAWGGKWLTLPVTSQAELDRALQCCADYSNDWPKTYRSKVAPMLQCCARANDPETRFTREEVEVLRAFLAVVDEFPENKPAGFSAGWHYPEAQARAIGILVRQGGRLLLHQAARRTAALRRWYCRWCGLYADEVWRRGRLRFADLPKLLRDDDPFGRGDASDEEWLCEIEYRMNSRFRHFLLDEFQDTSRAQWAVLEPMISCDDDHSLFLVGDVKQAIYGWRAGDSRLIGEVAGAMTQDSLKLSYRYGAGICEAINDIFGRFVSRSNLIPKAVRERWSDPQYFQPHAAAGERPGCFTVLALMPEPKGTEEDERKAPPPKTDYAEAAARLILARLRKLGFPGNPLRCGVLCRSGREGVAIRNRLVAMAPELAGRIIWDGNERVAGDPLVAALLAMLTAICHPAETVAVEMVRMYPRFAELLPRNAEEYAAAGALLDEGIAPMLLDLCRRIRQLRAEAPAECAPIPSENPANLEILLAAAAEFDAANPRGSVRDFCKLMRERKRSGIPQEGTLRMLTVHHSKGLTLDVVFYPLPVPQRNGLNLRTPEYGGMLAGGDRADVPDWLLFGVRAAEGALDPEIRRAAEFRHHDRIFEELCVLYVALTRARYETVLIVPPLAEKKLAVIHPDYKLSAKFHPKRIDELVREAWYLNDVLFEELFAERCQSGSPIPELEGMRVLRHTWGSADWPVPEGKTAEPPDPLSPPPPEPEFRPAPRRVTPSRSAETEIPPQLFFTLPAGEEEGADFGTRLHEYFASIDRLETAVPPADPALAAEIRRCRSTPAILDVIDEAADEVWKERPFDVLLDDPESPGGKVQLTGCFDRVHIRRDGAGRALAARIIDYKSNRVAAAGVEKLVLHYTPQLRWYRAALAQLLDLDPEKIRCTLIFTRPGAAAEVPPEA